MAAFGMALLEKFSNVYEECWKCWIALYVSFLLWYTMYSLEQSLISLPSASLKAFVDRYSVLQCITCSPWGGGGGGEGEPGYSINILVSKGEPLRVWDPDPV